MVSGTWPIKFSGGYIAIPGAQSDPFPAVDYCQFQMWAGKFIDPVADPTVLANFFQINTDPSTGAKTIVPAPLDETSRLAYVAAGVAPADMLSRAAAPNHYGKPDLFFNGGKNTFVTNRGSGGSFTKHGAPTTVGGPSGVPYDGV
jgi:hypothetical protein